MSNPVQDKVKKLFESRAKAEIALKKFQKAVIDAVNNTERRVRVKRLVMSCDEAMMTAYAKNHQLLDLAKKTADTCQSGQIWKNGSMTSQSQTMKS